MQGAGSYQQGKKVVLTATPNSGFSFVNWTMGDKIVSTAASFEYTMPASNTTLTANFEPVPVTDSAPLSELFREGVSVEYEGKSCPGVRQLVLGVYTLS